jgi:nicotinamide-nucleotide amidase
VLAEIITIGDEILIGQVIDTNSAWISQQLNHIGFKVKQITSVSDEQEHILSALHQASERADLIIITGGLGPTRDDKTKSALCEFFNTRLVFNQSAFENIEKLFTARNIRITIENKKQADLPESCTPLPNEIGTAWGMWFDKNNKAYVSLPGVPYEMQHLIKKQVLSKLKKKFNLPNIVHQTILTVGIGESNLAEIIEDWEDHLPPFIKLAYLPSPGLVRLRLSAEGDNKTELEYELKRQIEKLDRIIPEYIFGHGNETLEEIIGRMMSKKKLTISTAESCTGGYIAHLLTSVAGSSNYYKGSVIAYCNDIKTSELKVKNKTLQEFGAVSQEVAVQMAKEVRLKFKSDYAIGITGIAGPTGGTKEKPVGTVWIAVAGPSGINSKKFVFGDNRERNIRRSAIMALNLLREAVVEDQVSILNSLENAVRTAKNQ